MTDELNSETLSTNVNDRVAFVVKSVLGAVPFAGPLFVEIVGAVLPNQRIERITKFAESLGRRLEQIEQTGITAPTDDEHFTDLIEESLHQAARSLSNDRREYLASLIATGLSSADVEYIESKHLMRILGELNDIEVIWLRLHLETSMGDAANFREKHPAAFPNINATFTSSQSEHDKDTLQSSYEEHLARLGLLEVRRDERFTGLDVIKNYEITPFGGLLLRYIGVAGEEGFPI